MTPDACWQDNKQAWFKKRKASIVKAHMLLLAHLDREAVPPSLAADHKFVTTKCILLLEEMVKIANIPRAPGQTWGWLAPTVGSLEMMQCITQGVSQASRKSLGATGKVASPALGLRTRAHSNSSGPTSMALDVGHIMSSQSDLGGLTRACHPRVVPGLPREPGRHLQGSFTCFGFAHTSAAPKLRKDERSFQGGRIRHSSS